MTAALDRWHRYCGCGHKWGEHSLLDPDEGTRCFLCDCQEFVATEDIGGFNRRNYPISPPSEPNA